MHSTTRNDHTFPFIAGCLILLFLLPSSSNVMPAPRRTSRAPGIPSPVRRGFSPVGTATATFAMPPTLTTCPAPGTRRALITAPPVLRLPHHPLLTLHPRPPHSPLHC